MATIATGSELVQLSPSLSVRFQLLLWSLASSSPWITLVTSLIDETGPDAKTVMNLELLYIYLSLCENDSVFSFLPCWHLTCFLL